jgi:hypothetical protein
MALYNGKVNFAENLAGGDSSSGVPQVTKQFQCVPFN